MDLEYRSAGAVQAALEAMAQSQQSEQGDDLIYPDDTLRAHITEMNCQKVNGLRSHEIPLEKGFSGELMTRAIPDYPIDTISDMYFDANNEASGSLAKYEGQLIRPSSPSYGGTCETSLLKLVYFAAA